MSEGFNPEDPDDAWLEENRTIPLKDCRVPGLEAAVCNGGEEIIGCTNLWKCQSSFRSSEQNEFPAGHGVVYVFHGTDQGEVVGVDTYGPVQWDYTDLNVVDDGQAFGPPE